MLTDHCILYVSVSARPILEGIKVYDGHLWINFTQEKNVLVQLKSTLDPLHPPSILLVLNDTSHHVLVFSPS